MSIRYYLPVLQMLVLGGAIAQNTQNQWPPPPAEARIRYITSYGSNEDVNPQPSFFTRVLNFLFGEDEAQYRIVQPVGVAVDQRGRLYIADPGARCIHVINREEEQYTRITRGTDADLRSPVSIVFTDRGEMLVADSELKRVFVYDADGDPLRMIEGPFSRPMGLAIAGDSLFVADTGGHVIYIFSLGGELRGTIGSRGTGPGTFNYPLFLAIRESMYVVDAMNFRVQVLSRSDSTVSIIGSQGTSIGHFASPKGIALDSDGNIYVSDALLDVVQIFNRAGELLLVVGERGEYPGQFSHPAGIHIDANDRIYVTDALNGRVQVFQYLTRR
ncbi:MAG: hypothetical protein HY962_10995 [Ignavibacteriae bacterium]|nr:hypothetical protein [Ignavibacteriota bacterium]